MAHSNRWFVALLMLVALAIHGSTARLVRPQSLRIVHALEQFSTAMSLNDSDDHHYARPSGEDVSGVPKNSAKFHRSPCPALNTLANHGYLPRDGKELTPALLAHAVMHVFNLDKATADTLVGGLPTNLTLADLGEHNFIEHDASLVHDDAFFGHDPSQINDTLVEELLGRAGADGIITKEILAHFRHDREAQCYKANPKYDFPLKRQATAYAEAAALLLAMGDYETESISVAHAQSFLQYERIPEDFVKSKTPISRSTALYLAFRLKWLARH